MEQLPVVIGALALLAIAVTTLVRERHLIFWLAFAAPFVPIEYIHRYHLSLPSALKWAPYGALALAGGIAFATLPRRGPRFPPGVLLAYGLVLGVAVASMLVNGSSLAALLVSQRGYAIFFFAFFALCTVAQRYTRDELLAFLVAAGLLSSCVSMLQRVVVVPFAPGPDPGDRVTGLFAVGFIAMFFHLVCVGIVLCFALAGRRLLPGSPWLHLGVLILGIASGNQKVAVLYLPLVMGFTVLTARTRGAGFGRRGMILAGCACLGLLATTVFATFYDSDYSTPSDRSILQSLGDRDFVERYLLGTETSQFTPAGRLLRGAALRFSWRLVADDPTTMLLGLGPGATSDSGVAGASGSVAIRYPGYEVDRLSLSMLIADVGLLGVLAYAGFLVALLRGAGGRDEVPEHVSVRRIFVFLIVLNCVYANLSYEPIFALLAASISAAPIASHSHARSELACASA